MSRWLMEKATSVLEARSSRRGMLVRSAVVGSALAANPVDFVFRPISAYAATCMCRGQSCGCGSACCDGYTEFCCTLNGRNRCPKGTVAAGWWRAEGSGLCGGGSRYYMDCNVVPGQGSCGCQCAGNNCGNRVTCCVNFRYGQCHQEIPQVGAIVCRVVTCTAPWEFDPSCTTTDARDDATRFHDAPCLHEPDEEDDMPPAPAITFEADGTQWVFIRGVDGALWAKADNDNWFTLGGILTSGPSAMVTPDGKIVVVVRGSDNTTWRIKRNANGVWGAWESLGGLS